MGSHQKQNTQYDESVLQLSSAASQLNFPLCTVSEMYTLLLLMGMRLTSVSTSLMRYILHLNPNTFIHPVFLLTIKRIQAMLCHSSFSYHKSTSVSFIITIPYTVYIYIKKKKSLKKKSTVKNIPLENLHIYI